MANRANFHHVDKGARTIYTKTDDATLTESEIQNALVAVNNSVGDTVTLTFPTFEFKYKNCDCRIAVRHSGGTCIVSMTGNTSINDAITLLGGEMAIITSDGNSWMALHHTTAG